MKRRKTVISRFLAALALAPGTKGAIRTRDLSADSVAHAAKLVDAAERARHGVRRRSGGINSAKSMRKAYERRMKGARERNEDPREYFSDWVDEGHYTRRQLVNILTAVDAELAGTKLVTANNGQPTEAEVSPELVRWLFQKAGKKRPQK